jgi:hypothetical protein
MRGLCSHTSVGDEAGVANLKGHVDHDVATTTAQRLSATKGSTSYYLYTWLTMISSNISDPAKIAEVDQFGSDLEFPQHDGVQRGFDLCSYAAIQEATQEGEVEREE